MKTERDIKERLSLRLLFIKAWLFYYVQYIHVYSNITYIVILHTSYPLNYGPIAMKLDWCLNTNLRL